MIHVHYSRIVPENEQKRYESWLNRLLLAAQKTEGFIASHVIRPNSDDSSYHVLASFSSVNAAQTWENSREREVLIEESKSYTNEPIKITHHSNNLLWLETNTNTNGPQLIKWRMTILLFIVVASLVFTITPLVRLVLPDAPASIHLLLSIAIDVTLMTYAILPYLTEKLKKQLFTSHSIEEMS